MQPPPPMTPKTPVQSTPAAPVLTVEHDASQGQSGLGETTIWMISAPDVTEYPWNLTLLRPFSLRQPGLVIETDSPQSLQSSELQN